MWIRYEAKPVCQGIVYRETGTVPGDSPIKVGWGLCIDLDNAFSGLGAVSLRVRITRVSRSLVTQWAVISFLQVPTVAKTTTDCRKYAANTAKSFQPLMKSAWKVIIVRLQNTWGCKDSNPNSVPNSEPDDVSTDCKFEDIKTPRH